MSESPEAFRADFRGEMDDTKALQRYQKLVNTVDDGIYQLDAEGRFVAVNTTIVEMTAYSREELLGEPVSLLIDEDDSKRIAQEIQHRLATDESEAEPFEFTVRTADGDEIICELQLSLLIDDGDFQGTVGVVRDITDRKQTEQRLREREQQLKEERDLTDRLLETSPIGIQVLDDEGEVARINERAKEFLNAGDIDSYSPSDRRVYDEDGTLISVDEHPFARTLETGEPVYEVLQVEPPDGDRRWLSVNAAPILDEDGEIDRVVTTGEDVTDLKERERRLGRRRDALETELEEIYSRITDAIYALDDQWQFTHVNERAEELLEVPEEELLGETLWERFPEVDDNDEVQESLRKAMEEQESTNFEVYSELLEAWTEARIYPSESGVSVYFRDITERKDVERELRDRERQLSTLIDNVPEMVYSCKNEQGRPMKFVSDACQEVAGYDPDSLENGEVSWAEDIMVQEDREMVWETVQQETAEDQMFSETYRIETADREQQWVRDCGRGVFDDDGALIEIEGTISDITEQKRTEQRLAEERDMFADGPAVIFRWEPDGEAGWPVEYVSENVEDLLGYTAADLESGEIPYADLLLEEEIDRIAREVEENNDGTTERFSHEPYRIKTKDGDIRWVKDTTKIIRNESGQITNYLGYLVDITERKRHERELEESEHRYRTLVENFPNGAVVLVDEDLNYQIAGGTPVDVEADTADDLTGAHIREAISVELADALEPRYRAALEGEATQFELEHNGRHSQIYIFPVRDDDGEVFATMGMTQDITERKKYERQLKESNERLEQFASAASHDLQEPLRMVSSYLQLLERRYDEQLDEDGQEFLEFAVDGADRMREMIDGLLEYSRVERQGDPLQPVDLNDAFADVREDLQLQLAESDANVTAGDLPRVEGDPSQLRRLLSNLLDNAIEYSGDEPPRVHVAAEPDGDEWVVSVRDEGIGIDPDDQERIFDVFERLHTQEEFEGAGIGLALCERIVDRHGGDIWIESEPGEGTTVSFTLPVASDQEA